MKEEKQTILSVNNVVMDFKIGGKSILSKKENFTCFK